jgi:hypothetical protein
VRLVALGLEDPVDLGRGQISNTNHLISDVDAAIALGTSMYRPGTVAKRSSPLT